MPGMDGLAKPGAALLVLLLRAGLDFSFSR